MSERAHWSVLGPKFFIDRYPSLWVNASVYLNPWSVRPYGYVFRADFGIGWVRFVFAVSRRRP